MKTIRTISIITVVIILVRLMAGTNVFSQDNKIDISNVEAVGFKSGPNFETVLASLTDGDTNTQVNYQANIGDDEYVDDQYFIIDLGKVYDLEKVEIVFLKPATRVFTHELFISTDNSEYTLVN